MSVGATVAGRFFLEAEAGRGGMGTVYRARDADGSTVAVKQLTGDDAVDAARFAREAALLERLHHPNVVRYVDHGATGDGGAYLAMEWLEGETLAARAAQRPLAVDEALGVIAAAAAGLGAAHEHGIVHRDIKPANLFLVGSDPARVKVLDFGIARAAGRGHTLTSTGTVVGTPFYMAPEQARASARIDARVDVYALGAVLYELLTGEPPFTNESLMAVLAAILLEEPADVRRRAPHVPESVAALTMQMLAKDPAERPADCSALVQLIETMGTAPGSGPRSIAPPALTEREQRVMCLVLAAGRFGAVGSAATLAPGEGDAVGRLRAAVEAHGGRIELLADGSMVARMDAGGTAADQAVRAAHCALAMRDVVPTVPLAAVAGRGRLEGPIPVGEVIERGLARLGPDESREAGAVRLDDAMAGLLQGRFEVIDGGAGPVLGAEVTTPTTARTLLGRPSPCVGRRRELATLEALYAEAVEEPVARAVVIGAATGVGKTRLIRELLDRLADDDELEPPTVWTARADPLSEGSPFGLVSELVRSAVGIREGEAIEARRAKILGALSQRLPSDAAAKAAPWLGELARTPFAAPSMSMPPDDPKLRGDAMREAFLAWVGAVLDRGPLVMVLDDLQWGDRPSFSLIDATLRALADRPLLVIGAGRPELAERFGDLWAERDAQPLRLTKLRPTAARRLVANGLGDADDGLVDRLVERADGNPFFLEELVRAIAEHGPDAALPTTVLGMVEARLAVLEPATRRVLRAASVFGRRFWREGVVELLGGAARARDVDTHLDVLRVRELVDRVTPSRFSDHAELAFRHGLTREAALATLTDEDRRLGHRLAGAWLERAGERDALVLAEHHARGGDDARAARWLAEAAEQALAGDDLAAAIERAERALIGLDGEAPGADVSPPLTSDERAGDGAGSSTPPSGHRGAALVTLADAHRWRGEYPRALERAIQAAEALAPGTRAWFRALGVIFAAGGRLARHEQVARWRDEAVRAEAAADAVPAQVVALCRAATVALAQGDRARFEATMARAEALADDARPDPLSRAWIRTLRASEALRDGDHGAFVDGTAAAVEAYEAAGDPRDACNQRVRLGNGYVGLGDPERAEAVLHDALASARRMGLALVEGYALQNLGHAVLRTGRLFEAREIEERAVALARSIGDPILEAGSLLYLAEARELSGDAAGAVRDAERAVELLRAVPGFAAVARAVLARARLAAGDVERAADDAEAAFEALRTHDLEEGEALVRWVHVEALRARGRDAERHADEARARLEARAAHIRDPGWREGFLRGVPVHAATLGVQA